MIETVKRCVCDECNKEGPLALESESPVDIARTSDWVCFDDTHYCPDCAKKKGLAQHS